MQGRKEGMSCPATPTINQQTMKESHQSRHSSSKPPSQQKNHRASHCTTTEQTTIAKAQKQCMPPCLGCATVSLGVRPVCPTLPAERPQRCDRSFPAQLARIPCARPRLHMVCCYIGHSRKHCSSLSIGLALQNISDNPTTMQHVTFAQLRHPSSSQQAAAACLTAQPASMQVGCGKCPAHL
jgi:hypothetical protein